MVKQCPHIECTDLETGIVEVVLGRCEIGENCPGLEAGCPYAWKGSIRRNAAVNKMFSEYAEQKYRPQPIGFVG